ARSLRNSQSLINQLIQKSVTSSSTIKKHQSKTLAFLNQIISKHFQSKKMMHLKQLKIKL
ncbi:MAG: hypothetical protein Q8O62_01820, partial [Aequorivita sp.]|nr:hypothetical protein [Aequorivita sp.]